jgi:hypothetical protein
MSYITNKRIFYIDSHSRLSGDHNNFSYLMQLPPNNDFTHVCLLSCVIPKSYYLVQAGYNTFVLRENGVDTTITVPAGNYGATSFKTVVQGLLNTNSSQAWTYTITYPTITTSANTGKYTFTCDLGNPSFIFTTSLYEQFGFEPNSTNTFTSNTLTSQDVIKMQVEDTLYLHSDIASNGKDDILNEIFIGSSPDYSSIKYQCPDVDSYSKELQTNTSNVYSFWLTNEDNVLMDLNGLNIVLTLMVYKKENINEMIKNYIKYKLQ